MSTKIIEFLKVSNINKYDERGYRPLHAKDNFENCYKQYHALGANGMMDKLREEFLSLPLKPSNRMAKNKKK